MKITLAEHAGFCMGVQRALRLCMDLVRSRKHPIYTLGPIIHNSTVTGSLEALGVKCAKSVEDIEPGSWVLIRSHGITPKTRSRIAELGLNVCDATCPKVARVQSLIKSNVSQGYFVVIIGDHGHAETEGLLGYADTKGVVLSNIDEVDDFISRTGADTKVCVVAQTTQELELFDSLCTKLKGHFKDIKLMNTICDATRKRQDEVKVKGGDSECILVAGGKNSANTTRLYEMAQKTAKKSFHIERAEDLDLKSLESVKNVFITAGASTPRWIIHETADHIKGKGWLERSIRSIASKKVFYAILISYALYFLFTFSLDALFTMAGFALVNMEFRRYLMQKLDDLNSPALSRWLLFSGVITAIFASIIVQQLLLIPLLSYGLFFYMVYRNMSVRASVLFCASNVAALFVVLILIWG